MTVKSEHFRIGFSVVGLLVGAILSLLLLIPGASAPISTLRLEKKNSVIKTSIPNKSAEPLPITIQFFGDIMLDRNVAKAMGDQGLDYIFAKASQPIFDASDMRIANLEGPFAPGRVPTSKTIAFRFDPKFAAELKAYNFTAFNLANNHSNDMGRTNVAFTRKVLDDNGIHYFGDELDEGTEFTWVTATNTPNLASLPDNVAFIGLHNTYHNPDLKKVEATLLDARKKARYVIINIHWGVEYRRNSTTKQQDLAHWLIDHGADAVIGHHPHVIEEMEIYKDKPIFYSLGNFIFDQYFSTDTQEGLSVSLTLGEGKVKSVKLLPFYSEKSQIQLMDGNRLSAFWEWMNTNSRLEGKKIEDGKINL